MLRIPRYIDVSKIIPLEYQYQYPKIVPIIQSLLDFLPYFIILSIIIYCFCSIFSMDGAAISRQYIKLPVGKKMKYLNFIKRRYMYLIVIAYFAALGFYEHELIYEVHKWW